MTHPKCNCRSPFHRVVVVMLSALLVGMGLSVTAGAASGVPGASATTGSNGARASAAPTSWWAPSLGSQPWQWEISHPLNLSRPQDMGTHDKLPDGRPAPAPVIYDIDGIINPAPTVAALHAMGKRVVCYIEVGAAGNYY